MTEQKYNQDDGWTLRAWWLDLHAAAATLTRLPIGAPPAPAALSPRVRRAYPLVGALTGLAAGGVYFAANDVGLPIAVNAVLTVAALILIGGHMDDKGDRAVAPLLVATLLKIVAIFVFGDPATPGGGPHMVVLALVATGALSHAAALLLEPAPDTDASDIAPVDAYSDPKVVILPPDGTQITEEDLDEGNGSDLGPQTTAIIIALLLTVISLGLLPGAVAAAGATLGAWLAPRILMREIDADILPMPIALQQTAEVWALLGLAIFMSV